MHISSSSPSYLILRILLPLLLLFSIIIPTVHSQDQGQDQQQSDEQPPEQQEPPPPPPFFYKGHDLSSLFIMEAGPPGAIFKDTARDNETRLADDILIDGGMNTVRLRLWVDPIVPFDGPPGCKFPSLSFPSLPFFEVYLICITLNIQTPNSSNSFPFFPSKRLPNLQPPDNPLPRPTLHLQIPANLPRSPLLLLLGRPSQTNSPRKLAQRSLASRRHGTKLRILRNSRILHRRSSARASEFRE